MAKSANQKLKLLYLCRILLEQSDEEHPLTVQELIAYLARYDIRAERKSIYDDLNALSRFGLDVQFRKGHTPGWFVGTREFELPELKLLVDAVQSSRFITRKKSGALIRKLERLSSVYQAQQLQRQVFVSGRIKVMNESIYYNVDKLHSAIAAKRAITFQYFDYNMYRQKVFRRGGSRYTVSPYGLIWNNDNYYLVAYDGAHRQMRHYRVDKMEDIVVTVCDNVDIIVSWFVGSKDCRCPITGQINDAVLKLIDRYDIVIFDCEFDLKYLNQLVDTDIDTTIIVANPTDESAHLAKRIEEFSAKYAAGGQIGVVINKVENNEIASIYGLLNKYQLDVLGVIPLDKNLKENSIAKDSKIIEDAIKQFYFRLNLPQIKN